MSDFRVDPTSGRIALIAPRRQLRPRQHVHVASAGLVEKEYDRDCPFCPGNESSLPGILAETSVGSSTSWTVRVVPNKFPAVAPSHDIGKSSADGRGVPGYGFHEVIVESRRHDAHFASMTDIEIEAVVEAYSRRSRTLLARRMVEAVVVFRNHGEEGGASIRHPHSQVVALAFTPPLAALIAERGRQYHEANRRCPVCNDIARELDGAGRGM